MAFLAPEDLCNDALARMGSKLRVGSLFEGSLAAKTFLTLYGQTRDDLLCDGEWDFAIRSIGLTALKAAPAGGYIPPTVWTTAYPPPPWLFEYGYPSDALKIAAIRPTPLFVADMDPQPVLFRLANDPVSLAKVILCDVPNAIVTYTARVTNPTVWSASFTEALSASLARRAAAVLMGGEAAKQEVGDEAQADAAAMTQQG